MAFSIKKSKGNNLNKKYKKGSQNYNNATPFNSNNQNNNINNQNNNLNNLNNNPNNQINNPNNLNKNISDYNYGNVNDYNSFNSLSYGANQAMQMHNLDQQPDFNVAKTGSVPISNNTSNTTELFSTSETNLYEPSIHLKNNPNNLGAVNNKNLKNVNSHYTNSVFNKINSQNLNSSLGNNNNPKVNNIPRQYNNLGNTQELNNIDRFVDNNIPLPGVENKKPGYQNNPSQFNNTVNNREFNNNLNNNSSMQQPLNGNNTNKMNFADPTSEFSGVKLNQATTNGNQFETRTLNQQMQNNTNLNSQNRNSFGNNNNQGNGLVGNSQPVNYTSNIINSHSEKNNSQLGNKQFINNQQDIKNINQNVSYNNQNQDYNKQVNRNNNVDFNRNNTTQDIKKIAYKDQLYNNYKTYDPKSSVDPRIIESYENDKRNKQILLNKYSIDGSIEQHNQTPDQYFQKFEQLSPTQGDIRPYASRNVESYNSYNVNNNQQEIFDNGFENSTSEYLIHRQTQEFEPRNTYVPNEPEIIIKDNNVDRIVPEMISNNTFVNNQQAPIHQPNINPQVNQNVQQQSSYKPIPLNNFEQTQSMNQNANLNNTQSMDNLGNTQSINNVPYNQNSNLNNTQSMNNLDSTQSINSAPYNQNSSFVENRNNTQNLDNVEPIRFTQPIEQTRIMSQMENQNDNLGNNQPYNENLNYPNNNINTYSPSQPNQNINVNPNIQNNNLDEELIKKTIELEMLRARNNDLENINDPNNDFTDPYKKKVSDRVDNNSNNIESNNNDDYESLEFKLDNQNNIKPELSEDDKEFETQVFDSQSSQDEIKRNKRQEKIEKKERENNLLSAGAIKNVTPNKRYKIPSTKLLPNPDQGRTLSKEQILEKMSLLKNDINSIFETFKINAWVEEGNFNYGPTVLSFNVSVGVGVKVSRILKLSDNFKLRLKATTIRIQAPIPGKPYVGIEIPNPNPETVFFKPIFDTSMSKRKSESKYYSIDVPLGKDIYGNVKDFSLTKSPHLLVAGTTGSGKSVLINVILTSILMNYKPEELRLLLIDPKMVEFVPYSNLPHLITPVIHDPKKSKVALDKLVEKMEQRFKEMAEYGVRNIESWNELRKSEGLPIVPYVVVIIDELADLMMVSGKEVEISIARITQKARAAGIHMIVATQRPSTDVITGLIKSNIPTRIAFAVSSSIDSRTILDGGGAEALLGRGDMLVSLQGMAPFRAQSPYVSDMEINLITRNIKQQQSPEFDPDFDVLEELDVNDSLGLDDPLLQEAIQIIRETGKASTSYLQRRLRIGYNKAADIIDALEDAGYVGPPNGSKPREVY